MEAASEAAGVDVEFVVIPRRSLTVVFNRAAPPTFEQVRASIEVIEANRRWFHPADFVAALFREA
ncbi:hypothetical protein SAMN05421837_104266 [Amycolatopsis pretoriensis]|uniref:Uncharacterized protein n=1 Tax=Amycolatopsis pretoriensis TaxID=218821 RepID=A0A1H5QRA5_9PSEU|nr:hypothetical protein SAMN05421837_104266 [Amycolatopsis pretoriensis]